MPSKPIHKELFQLPARTLMDKFGSGTHSPGAGSAAAMSGILAGRLILTVATLTASKPKYSKVRSEMVVIAEQIREKFEPALYQAFQRDAESFDAVIKARRARDLAKGTSPERALQQIHLGHLRNATEIPMEIARHCLELAQLASNLFDRGFQSARGDSGAAASAALSGATASIFVTYLNLKSFRSSSWARKTQEDCDLLFQRCRRTGEELAERTHALRGEAVRSLSSSFDLELPLMQIATQATDVASSHRSD